MQLLTLYIVIGTVILIALSLLLIVYGRKVLASERTLMRQEDISYLNLSFEDINTVIDTVIVEVTMKKYNLYYRLREIQIIPDMEQQALEITTEILKSFSPKFINDITRFYTKEYFYAKVTREVQFFLVEYTDKHKPPTK